MSGQTAFFDIRVTHVNSLSNKNRNTAQTFRLHENAKKREYMQRILEVEHGSFTPLVFGTNGGMGVECARFVSKLAGMLAEKQNNRYETVVTWLRVRISLEIVRSALLCARGSRTTFRKCTADATDFCLDNIESRIV